MWCEHVSSRCDRSARAGRVRGVNITRKSVKDQPKHLSNIRPDLCQRSGDHGMSSVNRSRQFVKSHHASFPSSRGVFVRMECLSLLPPPREALVAAPRCRRSSGVLLSGLLLVVFERIFRMLGIAAVGDEGVDQRLVRLFLLG